MRKRECTHGGDPWTTTIITLILPGRRRMIRFEWKRDLMGGRPCGLPGHAIHDESGIVVGLQ